MERVLITSKSGNVYFDQRGCPLHTMGDINVTVGQWVWTNGTTIYGHQTAGYNPPVIGGPSPIVMLTVQDSGSFALKEADKIGNINDFLGSDTIKNIWWNHYVCKGDKAFGVIGGSWFDLVKKEKVLTNITDSGNASDAEIIDGDLYTCDDGYASYSYGPIQYFKVPHIWVWQPNDYYDWRREYYTSAVSYFGVQYGNNTSSTKDAHLYKNGDLQETISAQGYMDEAIAKVQEKIQTIQNKDVEGYKLPAETDQDSAPYSNYYSYRPRPDAYVNTASASVSLHINDDGTYNAKISVSCTGVCFPWFSHDWSDIITSRVYTVKEWLICLVTYSKTFVVGRDAAAIGENMSYNIKQVLIDGRDSASGPASPEPVEIIEGVEGIHFITSNSPEVIGPVELFLLSLNSSLWVDYQGPAEEVTYSWLTSLYNKNGGHGYSNGSSLSSYEYYLNDGFTFTDDFDGSGYISDPDYGTILTINSSDANFGNLYYTSSRATVYRLRKGLHLISFNRTYSNGLYLIENGNLKKLAETCTNTRIRQFKDKNKMQRNIKKIIDDNFVS